MELKGPYEAGVWNYSLNNAARNDIGKTMLIVGHLNVKNEAVVQGFLDRLASAGSVKGNETKAVVAYGFVNNHELERGHASDASIKCHLWFPDSEEHDVDLLDNGLICRIIVLSLVFIVAPINFLIQIPTSQEATEFIPSTLCH